MNRSFCSRADLVRALSAEHALLPAAAALLGYSHDVPSQAPPEELETGDQLPAPIKSSITSEIRQTPVAGGDWPDAQASCSFWLPFRYQPRERLPDDPPPEKGESIWRDQTAEAPTWHPIAEWSSVIPRIRARLSETTLSARIDVPEVVRRLAAGRLIHEVPRQRMRRWGDRLQLVVDQSEHLIPFYADQVYFREHLQNLLPQGAIELATYNDVTQRFRLLNDQGRTRDYRLPEPSVPIIVLSDLGGLRQPASSTIWGEWVAELAGREGPVLAIVPCSPTRVPARIRRSIEVIPWQHLRLARSCEEATFRSHLVDQLFRSLAPAKRIEPGLLRAVRRTIEQATDASLESDFWQDARLSSNHSTAATPHRERMPDFRDLSPDDRRRVLLLIRKWRHTLAPEVWMSEIWGLDEESKSTLPPRDQEDAKRLAATLGAQVGATMSDAMLAWLARATSSLPKHVLNRHKPLRILHRQALQHDDPLGGDPQESSQGSEKITVDVSQQGGLLVFSESSSTQSKQPGIQLLGSLHTTNRWLSIHRAEVASKRAAFWKSGTPPAWADDWGWDEYGPWATFRILRSGDVSGPSSTEVAEQFVSQRMRWIRPGRFLMGSPDDEEGRYPDEGPQHQVALTQGFWMFDTPVTQELWMAVMGKNPSQFKGETRPVDSVSWDNTQQFLARLNDQLRDEVFKLPTEAQWEYACRAGTTTRYAFGDELSSEQARFNSGDGTVPVGSYAPNDWGLFDMHGNVWEWCQDYWSDDYSQAEAVDPAGPASGRSRVVRGGSWSDGARLVRSAYRYHIVPGFRHYYFGFRCAQVPGAGEPREEEGEAAEPTASPTNEGGQTLQVAADAPHGVEIPTASIMIVRSDVDDLELRRIPRPDWATAMGRDRHGLWAEFTLDVQAIAEGREQRKRLFALQTEWMRGLVRRLRQSVATEHKPITQRMRWIPPGRFLMGSDPQDKMAASDEHPQHEVILSHGYWLFDTPVTQEVWAAVMQENRSGFPGERRPVENVSWNESQEFLKRINQLFAGLEWSLELTLPTEAEWEYACRAGTTTRYAFGNELSPDQARFNATTEKGTADVASYSPNEWGVFDMHGNVWEWCQDWYAPYQEQGQVNPQGPIEGHPRVVRGGSWRLYARYVRSASRSHLDPGHRLAHIGFRCAQVHPASRQASE